MTDIWDEFQENRSLFGLRPRRSPSSTGDRLGATIEQTASARCGAPSARPTRSASLLRGYEEAGVDQVIFVEPGRQQPPRAHLRVARAVRRPGHARVPRAGPAAQEAKAERLAPAIEAALARREPARELEGYTLRCSSRRVTPYGDRVSAAPRPVIVDTDGGIDDAVASGGR